SIRVSISGLVGISTVERVGVSTVDFQAKLQPIFRGSVQGVHMKTNGIGYGSSTIMDNVRQPSLGLTFGDRCQLACEVIDGALTEVIVINRGNNYISPPDIIVQDRAGSGRGAVVVPIISEGQVIEVKV